MGIQVSDLTPSQVTVYSPPGKAHLSKVFQVTRTETGPTVKALLPACSSVVGVRIYGSTASDATTSASVAVAILRDGATISSGSVDVKTNGTLTAIVQMSALPNQQALPAGGDLVVRTTKSTSGAETTGGPWNFIIDYIP